MVDINADIIESVITCGHIAMRIERDKRRAADYPAILAVAIAAGRLELKERECPECGAWMERVGDADPPYWECPECGEEEDDDSEPTQG